jgi:hypothetical protein
MRAIPKRVGRVLQSDKLNRSPKALVARFKSKRLVVRNNGICPRLNEQNRRCCTRYVTDGGRHNQPPVACCESRPQECHKRRCVPFHRELLRPTGGMICRAGHRDNRTHVARASLRPFIAFQGRITIAGSEQGDEAGACRTSNGTDTVWADPKPCRICTEPADCRLNIVLSRREPRLRRGPVLDTRRLRTPRRQDARQ